MMDDLIDRAAALEVYSELYWLDERLLNFRKELDFVYDAIRVMPAAKLEKKTGKWLALKISTGYSHPMYCCSHCNRNAPMVETGDLTNRYREALLTEYCPHCGAYMGGEQDDTGRS